MAVSGVLGGQRVKACVGLGEGGELGSLDGNPVCLQGANTLLLGQVTRPRDRAGERVREKKRELGIG